MIAMAYRDKLERLFRVWHIIDYRKRKRIRQSKKDKETQ
jgi:hypothetical protein